MLNNKKRLSNSKKNQFYLSIAAFIFMPFIVKSQNIVHANSFLDTITYNTLNYNLLSELVFNNFNEYRNKNRLDSLQQNQFFNTAALEFLHFEKNKQNTQVKGYNQQEALKRILIKNGGSGIGFGISGNAIIKNENNTQTYQNLASNIVITSLIKSSINKKLLESTLILAGIAFDLSENGKQLSYTIVLGGYLSENNGVSHISKLPYLSNKNRIKLKPYDSKECKRIDKLCNFYPDIYSGLKLENDELTLNIPNIKQLNSFVNDKYSGVAVDILLLDQFVNPQYNIVDYSEIGRGYVTKEIKLNPYKNKKNKKKQISSQRQINFEKLPSLPNKNYELNLILTQNNTACATIPPFYIEKFSGNYISNLNLLADTITINADFEYHPKIDSTIHNIKIPFNVNEYSFKNEKIDNLLEYLDEFNSVVKRVEITAYSSIEGNVMENELLQHKRAESVVDALKKRQKESLISQILTETNWLEFQRDILSTKHAFLATLSLDDARSYIKTHNLKYELEPILSKHRYAQIEVEIVNDINNVKEETFVIKQFHSAIESKDLPLALAIQKYIIKSVLNGRYSFNIVKELKIPLELPFAGMLMNNLYVKILSEGGEITKYAKEIEYLHILNPYNEYILYNNILIKILTVNSLNDNEIEKTQEQIQSLYYKTFTKKTVDALNMGFQTKIIQLADSIYNGRRYKQAAITRIKETFDSRQESHENALRLASLFIDIKDYNYAKQILDPYIFDNNYDSELAFCWISLCSIFPENMLTPQFAKVVKQSYYLDSLKLCNLFHKKTLTFRSLENPDVKKLYLEKCKCNFAFDSN